jgi:hypothetical protein
LVHFGQYQVKRGERRKERVRGERRKGERREGGREERGRGEGREEGREGEREVRGESRKCKKEKKKKDEFIFLFDFRYIGEIYYILTSPLYDHAPGLDKFMFCMFLFCTMLCFFASSAYHIFRSHSVRMFHVSSFFILNP